MGSMPRQPLSGRIYGPLLQLFCMANAAKSIAWSLFAVAPVIYPLVTNIANWKMAHRNSAKLLIKMVIFHRCVTSPAI
jgi:hypothetical protein